MSKKYYCGPYWVPKWGQKILSSQFNASCKIHDMDYESKEFTQQEADIRFLNNCIKQARGRFLVEVWACVYFILIRIGGKLSWDKDK